MTAELDAAVAQASRMGWSVVSRSDTQATIERGKNTNHVLHLLLSIITLGLWIPVWILASIGGGRKTRLITVADDGTVDVS